MTQEVGDPWLREVRDPVAQGVWTLWFGVGDSMAWGVGAPWCGIGDSMA